MHITAHLKEEVSILEEIKEKIVACTCREPDAVRYTVRLDPIDTHRFNEELVDAVANKELYQDASGDWCFGVLGRTVTIKRSPVPLLG